MDIRDIARHWDVDPGTVRRYKHEGRLPEPDAVTGSGRGRRFGWRQETIEAIQRPGRGARTDLHGGKRTSS